MMKKKLVAAAAALLALSASMLEASAFEDEILYADYLFTGAVSVRHDSEPGKGSPVSIGIQAGVDGYMDCFDGRLGVAGRVFENVDTDGKERRGGLRTGLAFRQQLTPTVEGFGAGLFGVRYGSGSDAFILYDGLDTGVECGIRLYPASMPSIAPMFSGGVDWEFVRFHDNDRQVTFHFACGVSFGPAVDDAHAAR